MEKRSTDRSQRDRSEIGTWKAGVCELITFCGDLCNLHIKWEFPVHSWHRAIDPALRGIIGCLCQVYL